MTDGKPDDSEIQLYNQPEWWSAWTQWILINFDQQVWTRDMGMLALIPGELTLKENSGIFLRKS